VSAFTLVEVLIVVIIIGILASIVVPQFSDAGQEARLNTTAEIVRALQRKVSEQYVRTGMWPATIEVSWFEGNQLPEHPENSFEVPAIEVYSGTDDLHPDDKVLKAGVAGAFWYNRDNGIVRARVADQGSTSATTDAYNRVNQCNESDVGGSDGGTSPWGS
jgi:prepilin-type N-terminal cleavage/methylation domain-containing protein